ncbi:MAG: nuclease [Chloroflexi bacterium]|nr:nuclease [Chloroflexota bacterium]
MPPLKTYDLFISHAWRYDDDYYRIVNFLEAANNFRYRNYSVPQHDPLDANDTARLALALQRQISPVNIVLVLSGMYVNYREWIQYEIGVAENYGKPIVGIKPWGSQRIPTAVQSAAVTMVGWNTSSIVDAIRKYSL